MGKYMILNQFDSRRLIALPGDDKAMIKFAAEHWLNIGNQSILDHGFFAVALSGGSTPKKIYQLLASPDQKSAIDWSKVFLFWSDERSVPPSNEDSNYHMALTEGGLSKLPIPSEHIFRMCAEVAIEENARIYELLIKEKLGGHPFDLVMLGMGEDGHTASLFPHTKALHVKNAWVAPNYIPQKKAWRMTLTFPGINSARHICVYVMGAPKAEILTKIFTFPFDFEKFPAQNVGTEEHRAMWILDNCASKNIVPRLKYLP